MTLQQQTIPAPAGSARAAYAPAPTHAPTHAPTAAPAGYAPGSQPVTAERYNLFSLMSFIGAFIVPIVGIVFGHLALRQVRRTQEPGRGFALAGLWIGYGTIALGVVFFFVYFGLIFSMMLTFGSLYSTIPSGYYA